jgi:hypothetical protein
MSIDMNMILAVRMISPLLGAAACILGASLLRRSAGTAYSQHRPWWGRRAFAWYWSRRTVPVRVWPDVKYCFHNKNEKENADQ